MRRSGGKRGGLANRPFRTAVERTIARHAANMWSHMAGTIAGEDIEELHEMRVASRRLRAVVEISAPCYPARPYRRFRRTIREITDQLAGVRDSDVMLDFLRGEREQASAEERPGLDDLIAHVTARREALRPRLVAFLTQLEAEDFPRRLDRFVSGRE